MSTETLNLVENLRDLKAGDRVYVVYQNGRHSKEQPVGAYVTVVKVGRKYGYLSGYVDRPFRLDNGHSHHPDDENARMNGYGFDVYVSEDAYSEYLRKSIERKLLPERLVDRFGRILNSVTDEQVAEIHAILDRR